MIIAQESIASDVLMLASKKIIFNMHVRAESEVKVCLSASSAVWSRSPSSSARYVGSASARTAVPPARSSASIARRKDRTAKEKISRLMLP